MNLQGDFEGSFLTSILQLLSDDQRTGTLSVGSGEKECKVFFREGTIVYAQSSQKQFRLGSLLRRHNIISENQLQEALRLTSNNQKALGKTLVDNGDINLGTLLEYNKNQAEEILYSILFWEKGKFEYRDASLQFKGMIMTKLNPMKLILEASRRIDEMSVLAERIPSDQLIYKKTNNPQEQQKLEFSPEERKILSSINRQRTVREIIDICSYDDFTAYKAFYSLLSSNIIEQTDGKEQSGLDAGFIISLYTELLKRITLPLNTGNGDNRYVLIEEAKENMPRSQAKLIQKFTLQAPAAVNRKNIKIAWEKSEKTSGHQLLALIDSFNGLLHLVLLQMNQRVDPHVMYKIIQEIKQVTEYVQKFQKDSMEKSKIISDMKNIIDDTIKQVRLAPQKRT